MGKEIKITAKTIVPRLQTILGLMAKGHGWRFTTQKYQYGEPDALFWIEYNDAIVEIEWELMNGFYSIFLNIKGIERLEFTVEEFFKGTYELGEKIAKLISNDLIGNVTGDEVQTRIDILRQQSKEVMKQQEFITDGWKDLFEEITKLEDWFEAYRDTLKRGV